MAAVMLAACTPLALVVHVTPLLSIALASRGDDETTSRQIAELERRQDWPGLAALAGERLRKEPGDPNWRLILGYAQMRRGDFSGAEASFAQAVGRRPEDIDAWNLLGESRRLTGRPGEAVATLEHAITVSPGSAATRFLLGEACRDAGRAQQAISSYRESVRLEPDFAPGWFGLGVMLLRTRQNDELPGIAARLQALDQVLGRELARLQQGNR